MKKTLAISAICLTVSGCASIVSGPTQGVRLQANDGSTYAVSDRNGGTISSGKTPASIDLPRGWGYFKTAHYKVKFNKPGYAPKIVDIVPNFNGWYLGNLLLPGGIVGMLIVDPSTGAMYKLNPTDIDVALDPNGDPLDEHGNLMKPPASSANAAVSKLDYEAQLLARAQRCDIFGNGSVTKTAAGEDQISYLCRDRRTITVACTTQSGCALK